jgi:uncharacterized protein
MQTDPITALNENLLAGEAATIIPPLPRDDFAARLRGFGPIGIAAILVITLTTAYVGNFLDIPVAALLVILWARRSRTSWADIGYVLPKNWPLTVAGGVAFGIALKFFMKAIVMPMLGADPINWSFHYLEGNRAVIPEMIFVLMIDAGFGEETVFRGYFFERLGKLIGNSFGAKALIVLITSTVFGLAHYAGQGLAGAEQGAIVGLIFGTIFAVTRQIVPLMIAHAAFDLTALAMIYWNLETRVAHFVFK